MAIQDCALKRKLRVLTHGMLLRAKTVMDDALPDLDMIRNLIPVVLHAEFDKIVARFEDTLCEADVSSRYVLSDELLHKEKQ